MTSIIDYILQESYIRIAVIEFSSSYCV